MFDLEKFVKTLEEIAADDSHGYDQIHRTGPDYDCSSLVSKGLKEAGANVGFLTTRSLPAALEKIGFTKITDSSRKRGDIFITPGVHVVTCTDDKNIVHASSNEYGKISGGKTGDQTGKEICIRSFYVRKGGWQYHYRYKTGLKTKKVLYEIGKTYTLTEAMNVRKGPGTTYEKKKKEELTADGQKHATKTGSLKKGTKITVLETRTFGKCVWVKCPSGWICAVGEDGVRYVV